VAWMGEVVDGNSERVEMRLVAVVDWDMVLIR
jgi:hypothetical protein